MYGAVLLPPHRDDADIAVLFMHNEGYSTMCGHGIIALTQGLIEEGLYPATTPTTEIRWETPAGLVKATAEVHKGRLGEPLVRAVRFINVPAYLHADRLADPSTRCAPLRGCGRAQGPERAACLWRGLLRHRRRLGAGHARGTWAAGIADAGRPAAITNVLRRDHSPTHPTDETLGFVYGTILVDSDPASSPDGLARDATIRNVTVFADAEVDRSPCGSGTSAVLAARHALGASDVGDELINAGITGEAFVARVEGTTMLGDRDAIVTSVQGRRFRDRPSFLSGR